MKNFTRGILFVVGIGLLVAPLSGKETRQLLATRVQEWRNSLPEDSRINYYATQLSDRVTSTRENWRDYAQQAVSKAKDKSSDISNKAVHSGQEIAHKARQSGQEMADKARQASQNMANKARQSTGFDKSSPNGASTRVISEDDK